MLREYQTTMLRDIGAAFLAGNRRVAAVMPTGAGKTVVFAEIVRRLGLRALIVAHRKELIRQASAKLQDVPHGIIAPWARPNRFHSVQVGSVQTLTRRAAVAADIVIPDECHHVVSKEYQRLLAQHPDAYVLGFTATPARLDGRGLGEVFQALVLGPTEADLITAGFLSPVVTFAPERAPDLRGVSTQAGDFMTRDLARVMDKPTVTGDAVAHYAREAAGQPALAFCVSVMHAGNTAAAFQAAGWRAASVDGSMSDRDRDAALAGLASGAIQVLTSCALIDEGLDVPAVGCVVDLAPTQSLGRFRQRVGRGMRPAPGKTRLVHLDHAGNTFRHGLPTAPQVWTLEGTPRRSRAAPAVAQCPQCWVMHSPGPMCPECGHDYREAREAEAARQIRHIAGTLTAVTLDDARLSHLRTAPLHELLAGAVSIDDVEAIRMARGYKPGWTHQAMRFRRRPRLRADGSEFQGVAA